MRMQGCAGVLSFFLSLFTSTVLADGPQLLNGHVPRMIAQLRPLGEFPQTNRLHLAISLPLRNQTALSNLLAQIYDPASPNYRHYLTPEQFTTRFGPSKQDYQAVVAFVNVNGLQVTRTWPNRMLVDVEGSVGDIERAMHTTLNVYRHPTENRNFYAPATEPSLNLSVAVLHISGLDNYALPHPHLMARRLVKGQTVSPNIGTGPGGLYMGHDFAAAYAPGALLDGSGQSVGLLEYDGYSASDINYYESLAGLPNVPLQNVLVDGADSGPAGPANADEEVALDIEMAISMATNLSQVVVYIASATSETPIEDILNQMVVSPQVKQFSSSWIFTGMSSDPSADQIWQQMAAQGQSFFQASGDSDAYTGLISFPCDTPYITQVGGTFLATHSPGGSWAGEDAWNDGNGVGSGGGISTQYPIPSWQTNISMVANQGSTTLRNTPDVAMVAYNVYARASGSDFNVQGTSCGAPLWAGFAALVNEQAADSDKSPIGLINAAADTIGTGSGYTMAFHDIATGNNTSSSSPTKFYAVPGYDLCTGWGTPAGAMLMDALADPDALIITPHIGIRSTGGPGGPFTVTSEELSLTNIGTNTLTWTLSNTSAWLTVSSAGGVLTPGGPATTVTVSLNSTANSLGLGTYTATLWLTNVTDGYGQGLANLLNVIARPLITSQPTNQAVLQGQTATFSVVATGGTPLSYQWQLNGFNLTDGTNIYGGDISGSQTPNLTVSYVSPANTGHYTVIVANAAGSVVSSKAALAIIHSAPVITMQPSSQMAVAGQTVVFNVAAVGDTPYLYQWYFDGVSIAGATSSSLLLTNVQLAQSGFFSVTVANAIGSTLSSNAVLKVFPAPNVLFFDDFHGPNLNPIWQTNLPNAYNGAFGPDMATYIGTPTYSFGLLGSNTVLNMDSVIGPLQRVGWSSSVNFQANNFRYEARFNTLYLSSTSSVDGFFEIWIINATNENLYDIVSPFAGFADNFIFMFFGSSVDGFYAFPDEFPFEVQDNTWYRLALQCLPGQNIRASLCDDNDNELIGYTFNHGVSAFGSGFKIVIAQTVGYSGQPAPTAVAVDYVRLTTGFVPMITTQPQSQITNEGSTVTFTVTTVGTPPLGYQWNFDGAGIPGATNSTLTLTDVQPVNSGVYSVVVTNIYGVAVSSNATLTVGSPPMITSGPTNQIAVVGGTAVFSVTANGSTPLNYQWNFNGTNIPDATNAALTLTNVQFSEAGDYSVTVTNIFGSAESSNVLLTVLGGGAPAILSQPKSLTVAAGGTATFSITAVGSSPLNYFWSFNGANIPGATNSTLTLTTAIPSQAGKYSVFVLNSFGSTNSAYATLIVTVQQLSQLRLATIFSSGTLYIYWPTNSAGFVLVTRTNLVSGAWVPVKALPLQFGNENVEPIVPTGTRAFYRLESTGN